ncbi:MAG: CRISPR-associated endonuclease Cas1 [Planctomycetota bacterium]|nr:MAG: CRISPR-associated endonuclease Cas1 [Planctomycetota bacterium]
MLNEFVYCPRLFYMEWVQGEWADNAYTVEGKIVHRRADRPTGELPAAEDERSFVARSVHLSSERLGLTCRMDVVEGEGGEVVPVDYKRGKPRSGERPLYDPERVQVCAQALILREHGYRVPRGEVYFAASRERVPVELDEELVELTLRSAREAKEVAASDTLPPPLEDSPKCDGCSLSGICLPDEVHLLEAESTTQDAPRVRRLHPARDDAVPFYVQRGGTRLGLRKGLLQVRERGELLAERSIEEVSQVSVYGGVQVSTQALRGLLQRDVPVAFFSAGGWFYGWTRGLGRHNVMLRRAQFRAADDSARCLSLARRLVATKIANQRTLLRRNHPDPEDALDRLSRLRRRAEEAASLAELLGLEGTAARIYYERFPGLLRVQWPDFHEGGRSKRPPRDPLNALFSFLYALLCKDWTVTLATVGLDPQVGFYHQPRFGRPALALDLMEEFRPLIADSTVLVLVNNGIVEPADFLRRGPAVSLRDSARKRVIAAYERRMSELVTHPVFGYRISYRRILEVQARLLGRHLMGEIETFPEFRTR